jgi:chromosome segregation ATPase
MADMIIETAIDELARILNEKKRITITEAARLLKTNPAQIEEWVKILEDHDLVELVYPAWGEPQIVLKGVEKKDMLKKKKEFEKRKDVVEEKTKEFQEKVEVVEKKVELTNKEFSELEDDLKDKLKELEKNLKNIDALENKKQDIMKKAEEIKNLADPINKEVESIKTDIEQMESKINEHIKSMEEHDKDIKTLDEDKKIIETEILDLDNEMRLINILLNKPVKVPMMDLKNIFKKHTEKTVEIKERKERLQERALKIKSIVSQKKDDTQKKRFLKFLKR